MTSSIGSILSNARTAMSASQTAITIISHNIANADTDGYSRQRAQLVPGLPLVTPNGVLGTGVRVEDVARIRDSLIDVGFRLDTSAAGEWQRRGALLGQIQDLHGDVLGLALPRALDAFWNAWSDLANDPTSATARLVVHQTGLQLTTQFHQMSAGLSAIRQSADRALRQDVDTVNRLAGSIASLNARILAAEAGGQTAGDLRDARDLAIDQLASLASIQVTERSNGTVGLNIGGVNIVDAADSVALTLDSSSGTLRVKSVRGAFLGSPGGAIGATIDILNTDLPAAVAELDAMASALTAEVNAIHSTGMNAAGLSGLAFFEDYGNPATVTAGSFSLSAAIADPLDIAAGTGAVDPVTGAVIYAAGHNDVALAIGALRSAPLASLGGVSVADAHAASVGRIGAQIRIAEDSAEVHRTLAFQADLQRSSVSGVNIDEELVQLIRFQNAYAAAARVITTADELLQTVIAMKR